MLPEGKCRYIDGQIYPDGNFFVLDTQHIKHNGSELKSALNGISTDISNKVDKETGKGLSTNDYTTAEKNKLSGIEANANNYVHPTTSGNKHIPSGGSSGKILGWSADGEAAWVDPTGGGGGSVDTVYIGSTEYAPDANGKVTLPTYPTTLPASDVYSWAKASSKPTYTASEVGLGNVGNFKAVSTVASQGLSNTEKSNARTNIGAGTGTVTGVKVGSTSYSPSSGVVSLPAYPTSLPADGGTADNVSGTVAVAHGGTGATSASSARSNLGLGSAATKSSTTSVTSGSSSLVTSGGVYTAISNKLGNLRSTVVLGGSSGVTKTIAIPSVDCNLYCLTGDGNILPTKTSLTNIIFLGGTKAYGVHDSTLKGLTSNSTDTVATLRVGAYDAALLLWTADISLSIN